MEKSTKTPNGDSNENNMKATVENTEQCTMILTNQQEVASAGIADVNVMTLNVIPAKNIEDGIRPENQGDALEPIEGVHISDKMVRVTNVEERNSKKAQSVDENEALKISREKLELSERARKKYEQSPESKDDEYGI